MDGGVDDDEFGDFADAAPVAVAAAAEAAPAVVDPAAAPVVPPSHDGEDDDFADFVGAAWDDGDAVGPAAALPSNAPSPVPQAVPVTVPTATGQAASSPPPATTPTAAPASSMDVDSRGGVVPDDDDFGAFESSAGDESAASEGAVEAPTPAPAPASPPGGHKAAVMDSGVGGVDDREGEDDGASSVDGADVEVAGIGDWSARHPSPGAESIPVSAGDGDQVEETATASTTSTARGLTPTGVELTPNLPTPHPPTPRAPDVEGGNGDGGAGQGDDDVGFGAFTSPAAPHDVFDDLDTLPTTPVDLGHAAPRRLFPPPLTAASNSVGEGCRMAKVVAETIPVSSPVPTTASPLLTPHRADVVVNAVATALGADLMAAGMEGAQVDAQVRQFAAQAREMLHPPATPIHSITALAFHWPPREDDAPSPAAVPATIGTGGGGVGSDEDDEWAAFEAGHAPSSHPTTTTITTTPAAILMPQAMDHEASAPVHVPAAAIHEATVADVRAILAGLVPPAMHAPGSTATAQVAPVPGAGVADQRVHRPYLPSIVTAAAWQPSNAAAMASICQPRPLPIASNTGRRRKSASHAKPLQSRPAEPPLPTTPTAGGKEGGRGMVPGCPTPTPAMPAAADTAPRGTATHTAASSHAASLRPVLHNNAITGAELDAFATMFGGPAPAPTPPLAPQPAATTSTPTAASAAIPAIASSPGDGELSKEEVVALAATIVAEFEAKLPSVHALLAPPRVWL